MNVDVKIDTFIFLDSIYISLTGLFLQAIAKLSLAWPNLDTGQ